MQKHTTLLCLFTALSLFASSQSTVTAKKRTASTTITINGNPNESAWEFNTNVSKTIIGTPNNTSSFAVLWDSLYLYVAIRVTDASRYNDSQNPWDDDAVEIYIDAENNGGTSYGTNDRQIMKEWNSSAIWEKNGRTTGITHAWSNISGGYAIEIRIPWSNIGITNPPNGFTIGFDVAVDDDDNAGARESQQMWNGDNNNWQYPQNFGDLILVSNDTQAPTAPSGLNVSNLAQTSLTLNWTASTDNIGVTGYDVYRNGTKINTSLVTGTSFNVTGLTAATAYQFYVNARDAAGNTSANSNTINITTPDTQAPTAPSNLVISNLQPTSLTISWSASSDNVGVAGYDLYQDGVKINTTTITGLSYAVTGLQPSTSYEYIVRAKDAAGNFSNSTPATITTPVPPDTEAPSAPTDFTASSITQHSVTLTWTASTDNIGVSGYNIYNNGVKVNTALVTATNYTVSALASAVSYNFHVVALDAAGNVSANSNTASITLPDTEDPSNPSGLAAANITQTSFDLTWNAATDNVGVTGYDVYQNGMQVNSVMITGTSFTVTGLIANTTYAFYVKAKDAAGNSGYSDEITVTTLPPPDTEAPTAPGNLSVSSITQSSLVLSWGGSTDNVAVAGYNIFRNGVRINSSPVTATTFNVTGLSAATWYLFYVQAVDAAGNVSDNSNTLNIVTPDTQAPTTPAGLVASSVTASSLTLTWNASTDNVGVTGYDVYQHGVKINSVPVTATNFTVTGLTQASSYSFFVRALDAAGNESANSNTINITTTDIQAPSAPANLVSSNLTSVSVTLTWSAATDNVGVAGYNVYRNGIKINGSLVTATFYNVTGLSVSTQYDFYVQATDAAGNISDNSNTISIITPDTQAPTAPANLAASSITASSLTLNWNASSDNVGVTGYDVYQDGIKINSIPVTLTSFNVTGLTQASSYSFFVRALDASGNVSANSNTISVSTPDTQAPSAPASLVSSNLTSVAVTLSWSAATDNVGVTGYNVYRNGTKINTSVVTALTYSATGLTASTTYSFYIRALDAAGNESANSNTINVTTPASTGCTGTGSIRFQRWNNITGTAVTNLTSNANYPNTPSTSGTLTSFEIPANAADNYGMKVFGYLCPPTTGTYTFWIASDDNAELWLSTTSSSANKVRIAYHTQWTNSREWNKYATQKSAAITLTAGQLYYIEALMKEGSQGDNMAVGWAKPGQSTTAPSEVIPGAQLIPQINDTQAPTTPINLSAGNITSSSIIINWTASTDNVGVAGYDVYRNGTKINSVLVTGTTFTASALAASTTYSFTVIAKDAAGNSSAASNTLQATTLIPNPGFETFTQRTVIANQRMPHDLVYGPDNNIWYTERFAGTVSFVNPANGVKTVVLTLGSSMARTGGQDGLMGLALHPQFATGKPYVYIAYTYQSTSATMRRTRIARYTYNSTTRQLEAPVTMLDNIPGSNDHNSARIAIGPDLKLYYSVGDMGAGQFDNMSRTNNAQNLAVYEGKILRLNTEVISSSWIPADNPFTSGGQPTAVYSFGHRNPQGLVWGNVNGTNILYSSEHGPYSDDEINIIEQGRNYGWPQAAGFCDGNYNGRTVGGFSIVSEQNNCATLNAKEPLRSLFPASNPPTGGDNMTWPSTGPSGTDFYGSNAIPGWQNSLLVAQLKNGTVTRLKLSSDGMSIISDTIHYFRGKGRFRDIVVSPDGLKLYVACDSSGSTSGPTGGVTTTPQNPGSILEFTYQPPAGGRTMSPLYTAVEKSTEATKEIKNTGFDIYPNPASHFIIVYNHQVQPGMSMELVDMSGRLARKQTITNLTTRITVSDLAGGVYVLKIIDSNGKTTKMEKVVIQR